MTLTVFVKFVLGKGQVDRGTVDPWRVRMRECIIFMTVQKKNTNLL